MRVALVHDYLNQFGGAERVLLTLMQMLPDAPIYTLLYDKEKTHGLFEGRRVITSFLDNSITRKHHRLFIPLMPIAISRLNLRGEFDLIISDTAGFAKGISYDQSKTKHISYIHTPLRYAWETNEYFSHNIKTKVFNAVFRPAFAYVRRFDYQVAQKPDMLFANSQFIAEKVQRYYGRDSDVLYPPVDTSVFYPDGQTGPAQYYLAAGRMLHYKRFDLIIETFKTLGLPLVVAGAGPKEQELKTLAQGARNITFLPFQKTSEEMRRLYSGAKAVIFSHTEDFGLVLAEAQACGAPIIAYNVGGAREIVSDERAGVLFNEQSVVGLVEAVRMFEQKKFDRKLIAQMAQRFSKEQFVAGIKGAIERLGV
jgi:glycosyltransferase involved in cell wall biosynthesis